MLFSFFPLSFFLLLVFVLFVLKYGTLGWRINAVINFPFLLLFSFSYRSILDWTAYAFLFFFLVFVCKLLDSLMIDNEFPCLICFHYFCYLVLLLTYLLGFMT